MDQIKKIIFFLEECEKLKSALRYSVTSGKRKESSAEHSRRLAIMVLLLGNEIGKDINVFHAVKIALFHDLAEAIVGDIDAYEIVKNPSLKETKEENEKRAMEHFKNILGGEQGDEIYSYRDEYKKAQTNEAKFVKALDKLETLNQFVDVGENIFDQPEFIARYVDKHVAKVPELKDVLMITKQRLKDSYEKRGFERKEEYDA